MAELAFAPEVDDLDLDARCGCCRGPELMNIRITQGSPLCRYCWENCVAWEAHRG